MSYCTVIIWNILLHLIALFLRVQKRWSLQNKRILFRNSRNKAYFPWKNTKVALLPQQELLLTVTGGLDLQRVFHAPSCFPLRRIKSGSGNCMGKKQSRFCVKFYASIIEHSILQHCHTGRLQSVTTDTLKGRKTQKKYVVLQPSILLLVLVI